MKRALIISLIILASLIGFHLLKFLSNTQNVFEVKPSRDFLESAGAGLVEIIHELSLQSTPLTPPLQNKTGLKGEKEDQINVLILGGGGKNHPGGHLTDTILIGSIALSKTKKATLFTIPRDLYVKIPNSNIWTKINAAYLYGGIDSLKSVIKDLMGLSMHYYIELDFDEFIKIIDALGGLPVYVEEDIYDPLFPGPNYSYEPFEISQGWHYLDGITALKYIRSRHSQGGDFDRTRRQQQILEALRIKLRSPKSFLSLNLVSTILGGLSGGFKTDIKPFEIGRFYMLANEIWPEFIENKIIDMGESGLLTGKDHPTAGSILIPKAGTGNYQEIREWVEKILE